MSAEGCPRIAGQGCEPLALPVVAGKGQPLVFRAWKPGDAMDKGVWSIPEPKADKLVLEPDILLAGKVLVGAREMRALGVESAYAMVDLVGEQRSFADPAGALSELAARVARTWSR